jgi:cephalosporin hydroxylase
MKSSFREQREREIARMGRDEGLRELSREWIERAAPYRYSYNFTWMGRPVIQFPQDLIALQEIFFRVRPRAIVETGVAHGGSLAFFASLLELLGGERLAVGVEIDLREENRKELAAHPLWPRMRVVEGSSTDVDVVAQVSELVEELAPVMVVLDSNHAHEHVLRELELYSPLVEPGSYLCVMDTIVERMPPELSSGRPWGPGDNPATAVEAFLETNLRFEVDRELDAKLLISVAPGGYLRCVA